MKKHVNLIDIVQQRASACLEIREKKYKGDSVNIELSQEERQDLTDIQNTEEKYDEQVTTGLIGDTRVQKGETLTMKPKT